MRVPIAVRIAFSLLLVVSAPRTSYGFSVLAHQAVIDATWNTSLVPALRRRFPHASDADVEHARAFAYGGAHVADLGYFPLGNRLFTDLLHYVRSGDFLTALVASAQTVDEYAFALGAVAHYVTDTIGHPEATNRAVAEMYPHLRHKYGETVTYADDHGSHMQTEFRFDVLQMSRDKRTRDLFHHAVAFQVAKRPLDEAFRKTYGLGLDDVFGNTDVAILTYRLAFRELVHEATGIAWELYRADIQKLDPQATSAGFVYDMSRSDFDEEFGKTYRQPGYFAKFFALVVKLVPNVGPLKRTVYEPLPPHVVQLFTAALDDSVARYRDVVAAARTSHVALEDRNLDTGRRARAGEYQPADEAYASLLTKLAERDFRDVPPQLRADILRYYGRTGGGGGGTAPAAAARSTAKARKIARDLDRLAAFREQS